MPASQYAMISGFLVAMASGLSAAEGRASGEIDFDAQIRPILERACLSCHDRENGKGGLVLSNGRAALKPTNSGLPAIVPGKPEESELLYRISTPDEFDRMPPEGDRLAQAEIDRLRDWIAQGASWPEAGDAEEITHWAYEPIEPVEPPNVEAGDWARGPIDAFVLAKLEAEGLRPAPEAEPARLLRRLHLALTGLPPRIEEIDAFVADPSERAYETAVDRLLASPAFGERWARAWLDLARYADSNGFQADQLRESWAYRDWVIDALNADMPFDQFTIEQLAGDLLSNPTLEQQFATGFHRAAPCNVEAGVLPEENRVNQVFDRVNTTGTVFLGTTLECAQCHNHKYDPITQLDYYRFFAFFNNTPLEVVSNGGVQYNFSGPSLDLPFTPEQKRRRTELRDWIKGLEWVDRSLSATPRPLGLEHLALRSTIERSAKERSAIRPHSTLVMVELEEPRETYLLKRGNYQDPGPKVEPGTPEFLPPMDPAAPRNRLGLARWLVSADNPLVPRVAVNRLWAGLFGQGLVTTPEDFGAQSDPPSHPELLDWLALELIERGWSQKAIIREIVLSSTFRQSSKVDSEALERDPPNRFLARGPRFRMSAEMIRDQALAASGLLSRRMHGPPVMPFQPNGVWRAVGRNAPKWVESPGPDRFRRGVYVVWRRAAPYPSFVSFDAPDRAACTVERPRTNTPLQALVLLNDRAFVETALGLAERVVSKQPEGPVSTRAETLFRLVLARRPTEREAAELERLYEDASRELQDEPRRAEALLSWRRGASEPQGRHQRVEIAAWSVVASVVLNLDETVTRD